MQLFGGTVWCALGGGNMHNVILPVVVERVTIYGDNGEAGHRFAEQAAETFWRQGRKVTLSFPLGLFDDFNDVLQNKEAAA